MLTNKVSLELRLFCLASSKLCAADLESLILGTKVSGVTQTK